MAQVSELRTGAKMSPQDAKAYVEHLYAKMYAHWQTKIPNSSFMTQLCEGKLPMPVIRQFFKNWGHFLPGSQCAECALLSHPPSLLRSAF